jgi:hypothetical protein
MAYIASSLSYLRKIFVTLPLVSTRVASGFTRKCQTRLERLTKSKHSSLFGLFISDEEIPLTIIVSVMKLFSLSLTLRQISKRVRP